MKKKTVAKIILDVLMITAVALMYSKQALGLKFHEIGGLVLIGAFFLHKGLNFKWIRCVTSRLCLADARTRLMWTVDALMLLSFLTVGVTGILISKIAFPGLNVQGGPWKSLHYGSAALSLLWVGVHLGLHYNYLKGVFSRRVRLPRVVAVALMVILMAYGAYGLASTGFVRWLAMLFGISAQEGEGSRGGRGQFPSHDSGSAAPDSAFAEADGDSTQASASDTSGQTDGGPAQTFGDSSQGAGQLGGQGFGGHGGPSGSLGAALSTFTQFFSIAFLFAALTAFIDQSLRRKKRRAAA